MPLARLAAGSHEVSGNASLGISQCYFIEFITDLGFRWVKFAVKKCFTQPIDGMDINLAKQNISLTNLSLFLWAVAEGSFFFVMPDVLLAPLAARAPKSWRKLVVLCVSGSLLGSLLPFFLAKYIPETGYYLLRHIALISQVKIDRVASTLHNLGYTAFILQPFSLIPLKAFVFSASLANYLPLAIIAMIILGRGLRNSIVAYLASQIGDKFERQLHKHHAAYLCGWAVFCACLVALAIIAP